MCQGVVASINTHSRVVNQEASKTVCGRSQGRRRERGILFHSKVLGLCIPPVRLPLAAGNPGALPCQCPAPSHQLGQDLGCIPVLGTRSPHTREQTCPTACTGESGSIHLSSCPCIAEIWSLLLCVLCLSSAMAIYCTSSVLRSFLLCSAALTLSLFINDWDTLARQLPQEHPRQRCLLKGLLAPPVSEDWNLVCKSPQQSRSARDTCFAGGNMEQLLSKICSEAEHVPVSCLYRQAAFR